jgi:hypothetical protein
MKELHIPNTDEIELRRCRQFYFAYPSAANLIATDPKMKGLLPSESIETDIKLFPNQIRGSLNPELNEDPIELTNNQIRGTASLEFKVPNIHYINLFKRLSYSHFIELMKMEEPLKRLIYELECVKGTWSLKELKRQIGSLLYERTGLSENKEKLVASKSRFAFIFRHYPRPVYC